MFCTHCGAEINDGAAICTRCGTQVRGLVYNASTRSNNETTEAMQTVVKVFMLLGCIAYGWLLIPLAWCIPMTVSVFRSFKEGRPVSTGMKVCTLLFVNLVAGICLLCIDDSKI